MGAPFARYGSLWPLTDPQGDGADGEMWGGSRGHGQCSDYGFGLQTNTKMSEYILFLAKKSLGWKALRISITQ